MTAWHRLLMSLWWLWLAQVASGKVKVEDSPLRNAPHTIDTVLAADWNKPYSR